MKPKHRGGYSATHTSLCERTLVTLLRGLGPWKESVVLAGGLVPRYLLDTSTHVGTTDVDLVVNLEEAEAVEAYRTLEENLTRLGFVRGRNDEQRPTNYSWRKTIGQVTVVLDLLCPAGGPQGGGVQSVPGSRRLSALRLAGAHLALEDFVTVPVTAELLDDRGVATETVRVTNLVPFLVLKALAYEERAEHKDAYDIVYCLLNAPAGVSELARTFRAAMAQWPDEPLLEKCLTILRKRFGSDETTPGHRKDGPVSYAAFLTDPGQPERNMRLRQEATGVVTRFLSVVTEPERPG